MILMAMLITRSALLREGRVAPRTGRFSEQGKELAEEDRDDKVATTGDDSRVAQEQRDVPWTQHGRTEQWVHPFRYVLCPSASGPRAGSQPTVISTPSPLRSRYSLGREDTGWDMPLKVVVSAL